MSIQKIARMAGVSVATVSRVLNNLESVKPHNRERVLQAIEACNYQPNLLARQLRTARSNMLLVMVSDISNPFCAGVVMGVEAAAEKQGYRILLFNSGSDMARVRSCLQLLSGKMVDGVITIHALETLPELNQLIGDAPWVQCSEYDDTSGVSSVGVNDREATAYVINQFHQRGCARIAMINHDLSYKYARQREQGYREGLAESGLTWQAIHYVNEVSYQDGREAMHALLTQPERPDAVFAISDTLAAGALTAIQEAGLRVPQDIALVGFDGTELGEMTTPQLSTVVQPARELGRNAARLLLRKIEDPGSAAERIILDWTFLRRASS